MVARWCLPARGSDESSKKVVRDRSRFEVEQPEIKARQCRGKVWMKRCWRIVQGEVVLEEGLDAATRSWRAKRIGWGIDSLQAAADRMEGGLGACAFAPAKAPHLGRDPTCSTDQVEKRSRRASKRAEIFDGQRLLFSFPYQWLMTIPQFKYMIGRG